MPYSDPDRWRIDRLPLPRHWVTLCLGLTVAVVAGGLVARFASGVTAAELSVDQLVSAHHEGVLAQLALLLNTLFEPAVGVVVLVVVTAFVWLVVRAPERAVLFALTTGSGWLVCQVFKMVVGRVRPDPALLPDPLVAEPVSNSFPSGHTCLAVALVFGLYVLLRGTRWVRPAVTAASIIAVVVAWSRVYVGAHYPLDVVASFPATTAAVVLVAGLWNRHAPAIGARLHASASHTREKRQ